MIDYSPYKNAWEVDSFGIFAEVTAEFFLFWSIYRSWVILVNLHRIYGESASVFGGILILQ